MGIFAGTLTTPGWCSLIHNPRFTQAKNTPSTKQGSDPPCSPLPHLHVCWAVLAVHAFLGQGTRPLVVVRELVWVGRTAGLGLGQQPRSVSPFLVVWGRL